MKCTNVPIQPMGTRLLAGQHADHSGHILWAERELDLVAATPALLAVGHAATH